MHILSSTPCFVNCVLHPFSCDFFPLEAPDFSCTGSSVLYPCVWYGCETQNSGNKEILMLLHRDCFSRVICVSPSRVWGAGAPLVFGVLHPQRINRTHCSLLWSLKICLYLSAWIHNNCLLRGSTQQLLKWTQRPTAKCETKLRK